MGTNATVETVNSNTVNTMRKTLLTLRAEQETVRTGSKRFFQIRREVQQLVNALYSAAQ